MRPVTKNIILIREIAVPRLAAQTLWEFQEVFDAAKFCVIGVTDNP